MLGKDKKRLIARDHEIARSEILEKRVQATQVELSDFEYTQSQWMRAGSVYTEQLHWRIGNIKLKGLI